MIRELLYNKWFYSFVIAWVLFFLLVDRRALSRNIWGGILASLLELWQDATAYGAGIYYMQDTGVALLNVSVFLTLGPALTMGIIFFQTVPRNPRLQLINIIVFSVGFLIYEEILKSNGLLVEPHWIHTGSFFVNIIIFGSLTWIKQYILYKTRPDR